VRLKIRHNMEIAHRLSLDTGKCKQIHGHGMQVELTLLANEGPNGMAVNSANQSMEFGAMKNMFRVYIDTKYDHHLVLNESDPWAQLINISTDRDMNDWQSLPGLTTVPGDPTTENLCKWIAEWACANYRVDVICTIAETATNGAEVMYHWNSFGASMMKGAL
jgi:6-pyruvoyl-tetrahydropterin synthase